MMEARTFRSESVVRIRLVSLVWLTTVVGAAAGCSNGEESSGDATDTGVSDQRDVADTSFPDDEGVDGSIDGSDTASPDTREDDAGDADTSPSGGIADLVTTDHRLEPIPPRELGNFHIKMIVTLRNEGPATATGLICFYKIVPTEMRGQIQTIQGEVPLDQSSLEAEAQRDVSVELDRDAESGDQDYNARFEIRCNAENEQSETEDDNSASITSTVQYY